MTEKRASSPAGCLKPTLSSAPYLTEPMRIQICNRIYYKEFLVPELDKCEANYTDVCRIVSITLDVLNSHDVLDMQPSTMDTLKDYLLLVKYLNTLCFFTLGLKFKDRL